MFPRLFLFAIIILTLTTPVAHATVQLEAVDLEWVDSGKELLPGYEVSVSVKAEGSTLLGGLADAGFKVVSGGRSYRFGVTQDGRDVYVFFEGHTYKIDVLPWAARKQYNAVFTVKLYCPGEAPPGMSPAGRLLVDGGLRARLDRSHALLPRTGSGSRWRGA